MCNYLQLCRGDGLKFQFIITKTVLLEVMQWQLHPGALVRRKFGLDNQRGLSMSYMWFKCKQNIGYRIDVHNVIKDGLGAGSCAVLMINIWL